MPSKSPWAWKSLWTWEQAVPNPLSGERDGLVVLLPVEHRWRHAYHPALQPHWVAFRNSAVLQFLQDHGGFLHLFGWMREGPFLFELWAPWGSCFKVITTLEFNRVGTRPPHLLFRTLLIPLRKIIALIKAPQVMKKGMREGLCILYERQHSRIWFAHGGREWWVWNLRRLFYSQQ